MTLNELKTQIKPLDMRYCEAAKRRWDSIAKPLNSLGAMEQIICKIAGITGSADVDISRRCVTVFCADNGVVEEGVTQTGSEVTAIVTENFTKGKASVNAMARAAHCEVIPVDIGVERDVHGEGLLIHKISRGTQNMVREPAMTRDQAIEAIEFGASLAESLKEQGFRLILTGEMGIGNTTTSSAVASVLLGKAPAEVTGRGAGLSREGLMRKVTAIEAAIAKNKPDPADAVDVLAKVGGYDLAGLCGIFLGGAAVRLPVMIDGFISATAALAASRICPAVTDSLLPSHCSKEPASAMLMQALDLRPFLYADMCLGEGTGAVASLPFLDMGLAVYREMSTFEEIKVEQYQPLN
ncbi:MAG: nicotinate-nucleotide--dimethylbenzimidazole phosphoribosyltransferase [Ruminococcaceae bacterium]|jgi:nicotinate-nucleotide--dimethylbenzimidazole phosphoribosyltransferase|nr:nicotinate-nucleotide--dimethylbenzimidazole phosphoribosyltransferase [Oscillospiraceae bacterium]